MTDREKLIELFVESAAMDYKDSAEYFLTNGVTFQKWIPVSERLPDKMMQCVCQYQFGENAEFRFYTVLWYFANEEKPHFQDEGRMGLMVTHWMPLPELPKEDAK